MPVTRVQFELLLILLTDGTLNLTLNRSHRITRCKSAFRTLRPLDDYVNREASYLNKGSGVKVMRVFA